MFYILLGGGDYGLYRDYNIVDTRYIFEFTGYHGRIRRRVGSALSPSIDSFDVTMSSPKMSTPDSAVDAAARCYIQTGTRFKRAQTCLRRARTPMTPPSITEISRRFKVPRSTLRRWVDALTALKPVDGAGRPAALTIEEETTLVAFIDQRCKK